MQSHFWDVQCEEEGVHCRIHATWCGQAWLSEARQGWTKLPSHRALSQREPHLGLREDVAHLVLHGHVVEVELGRKPSGKAWCHRPEEEEMCKHMITKDTSSQMHWAYTLFLKTLSCLNLPICSLIMDIHLPFSLLKFPLTGVPSPSHPQLQFLASCIIHIRHSSQLQILFLPFLFFSQETSTSLFF